MQDALHSFAGPLERSFLFAGALYLFLWIIGHKPSNLEALYVFGVVSAFVLAINFIDASNWFVLVLLLSWIPAFRQKSKPTFLSK